MDKRIRRNEICIIGLPRCDFVFSSTRSCFIAYGFEESSLEMTILRRLLEERNIQPVEAGGTLAPGQNAFCSKICSKIIVAQFCAVLLNNEERVDIEIPNANVNMEYGLMLGFNKYVIPFQHSSQKLPFNVAGLDTMSSRLRTPGLQAKVCFLRLPSGFPMVPQYLRHTPVVPQSLSEPDKRLSHIRLFA